MTSEKENFIGKTFRDLREKKSFLLKEAAGDVVSVTQLSTFENRKSMLRTDRFFGILRNINVSMIEFQSLYNQSIKENDPLLLNSRVYDAYMEKNISKLKMILKSVEKEIRDNPKVKKYQLDRMIVKAKLSELDPSYEIPKKEIQQLKTYLMSIKEWGRYEISLLGSCGKVFDNATLSVLYHQMISPTQINQDLYYVQRVKVRAVINIINFFTDKKQFQLAKELIHYLDKINVPDSYMYEKMTFTYSKAYLLFMETGDLTAIDTMNTCEAAFEFCGCLETANWAENEIDKMVKAHKS